jgi:excisionase family DNA binding protein
LVPANLIAGKRLTHFKEMYFPPRTAEITTPLQSFKDCKASILLIPLRGWVGKSRRRLVHCLQLRTNMRKQNQPVHAGGTITPRLLRVAEAALYLGCATWALRTLAWEKKLKPVMIGRRLLFDKLDLDAFVDAQKKLVT